MDRYATLCRVCRAWIWKAGLPILWCWLPVPAAAAAAVPAAGAALGPCRPGGEARGWLPARHARVQSPAPDPRLALSAGPAGCREQGAVRGGAGGGGGGAECQGVGRWRWRWRWEWTTTAWKRLAGGACGMHVLGFPAPQYVQPFLTCGELPSSRCPPSTQ